MVSGLTPWHQDCPRCRYEHANLEVAINHSIASAAIDESARADALKDLRQANFKQILKAIATYKTKGTLLDVGAAHGWFLDLVRTQFDAVGIEPDEKIAGETIARGCAVKIGYFPQALSASDSFDVIIFNDVIEHIPDISQVLQDCKAHLNKDGLLVINLPSSNGVFYRLSRYLYRLGYSSFFERMWQKGLPSPHLHYFNKNNLVQLLRAHDLSILHADRLESIRLSGLYTRLAYTKGQQSFLQKILIYCGVATSLPFLRALPSDIIFVIAQKGK